MNAKTLLILTAATAALAGAAFLTARGRAPAEIPADAADTPLFSALESRAGEVARIEIKRGKSEAVLAREPGGKAWLIESKGNYPAKFDLVRPIVSALAEATQIETKTSKPELYDKLEVGDPAREDAKSTLIVLKSADGNELAALILGKRDWGAKGLDPFTPPPPGKARHYVRKGGQAQSYLAEIELEVQADPLSFADKTIAELKNERIKSAVIARPDGSIIAVGRDKADDTKFNLINAPDGRALKDEFAASRVAQALNYVTFDDVRPVAEIDFNASETTTYEARCFDGAIVTVRVLNADGKFWAVFSSSFEEPPMPVPGPATPVAAPPEANKPADVNTPDGDEGDASKTPTPTPPPDADPAAVETHRAASEATTKEVAEWNAKWGKWAFAIPQFKVEQMLPTIEDLLAPKPAEQNPPSTPSEPEDESSLRPPPK
ncbi:MAG: DUF4340 domain-containing protein [Phycisphaerae bacterium]|nr:DUF4340 domain-containing protein [Phycisphaerae bacterium]